MQEKEEKFAKTIGRIIKTYRQNNPKKYVLFCDENSISNSTLNNIENGIRSAKLYTILKIINALGLSFREFGEILDNEIPLEFLSDED